LSPPCCLLRYDFNLRNARDYFSNRQLFFLTVFKSEPI
jgi:hypothetical protein